MIDAFTMLGASFTLVMLLMGACWLHYFFQRNASIGDIGWGIGFIIAVWSYFFLGIGDSLKMLAIAFMVTIWAGRLTYYILLRYHTSEEDPRYHLVRERWRETTPERLLFLIFYIFQGVLIIVLSLPFFLICFGSNSQWTQWEGWGFLLWLIGVAGETAADAQLFAFRKDPANKGHVFRKGLWRFSRHPNYFFEFIVWIGFYLFALPSYGGGFAIISPIIMLALLLKVSGIPLTETEALNTKGDAYREYQRTTSAFIPWFPKS